MIIRIILTIALIIASYRETGIFTALSLLLIFAAIEINNYIVKKLVDKIL